MVVLGVVAASHWVVALADLSVADYARTRLAAVEPAEQACAGEGLRFDENQTRNDRETDQKARVSLKVSKGCCGLLRLAETLPEMSLGIIGGLGAAAGVRFADMLVKEAQARGARKDSEFPEFILLNIPFHDTSEAGVDSDGAEPRRQLIGAFHRIESLLCFDAIVACNTAHIWYDWIVEEEYKGWINMIDETAEHCSLSYTLVGVLSSATTKKHGLYGKALKQHDIETIETTPEEQESVTGIIGYAMAGSRKHAKEIDNVIRRMEKDGAQAIILGCTELPMVIESGRFNIPLIDSGNVAIKSLLDTHG